MISGTYAGTSDTRCAGTSDTGYAGTGDRSIEESVSGLLYARLTLCIRDYPTLAAALEVCVNVEINLAAFGSRVWGVDMSGVEDSTPALEAYTAPTCQLPRQGVRYLHG